MEIKNAIIIDKITYKVVRRTYYGFYPQEKGPCDLCDIKKYCERDDAQPCRIFNERYRLAHFKKVASI